MTLHISGIFQITSWDETTDIQHPDGAKQTSASITQMYSGDLEGVSQPKYIMCYTTDAQAVFCGYENVEVTINGKSGSFVLQHNGKFEQGVAISSFIIVPNSGQGELANIDGKGSFTSGEKGQANYQMEITSL
ncbi:MULTISPECIES: DUF3224 domain-containing protein [Shewanella]|uniref:DUF3224 domain-containing protein n=1 Tax=Shewanella japonica TaxID=93973 RepID=A0ABM6JLH7_9GAMM|nr:MULTISPECIES: DUF3224 domain-containing protein [Shewanella]ARD23076.1 hypothetical protein SJ2017_2795 [Shewanella japonica]MBQ4892211.1 DUF3224 domain-containing protein [Shewanella sp. MMG014]OBT03781.1 hypothetical protein A9267_19505 [Shewanella sp. UCD-FRSSP16_17]